MSGRISSEPTPKIGSTLLGVQELEQINCTQESKHTNDCRFMQASRPKLSPINTLYEINPHAMISSRGGESTLFRRKTMYCCCGNWYRYVLLQGAAGHTYLHQRTRGPNGRSPTIRRRCHRMALPHAHLMKVERVHVATGLASSENKAVGPEVSDSARTP